ncbi:hypothetical protein DENSPDRAFT_315658 [Dentipellis sp. KUC8613]|nr:hypothetical protein DENSPDRAFT_315658 [Dentipellis sp. KUC8613]
MSVCGEQHFRQEISSLWVITLFYGQRLSVLEIDVSECLSGLYVALFGGSIYVLINRRRNTYFLCTSIALFMLTTAYMATSLATILATPIEVSNSYSTSTAVLSCTAETPERLNEVVIGNLTSVVQSSLTACMNLISGSVLVYRCMALWPQRRGIAVPLGFMLLASTALGFACVYLQEQEYIIRKDAPLTETVPPPRWIELGIDYDDLHNVSNVLNTIVDSVATVIVASRIWYLARQLESTLGQKAGLRYRAAVSMFIESGILIMMSEVLTTVLGISSLA